MNRNIWVAGILVDERANHALEVQQVLTEFGPVITSRGGIPDPGRRRGIITLTMQATDDEKQDLENKLKKIPGVSVKSLCLAESTE
ncbi:MAG: hypothetical protein H5T98_08120 [Syntrophomonadaceae bacterium]|nr:hypothetical protein [Syntrophomonadaceae bacterium]